MNMYKCAGSYFKAENDHSAVYQYSSFLTVCKEEHIKPLLKVVDIEEDKTMEVELCNPNEVKLLCHTIIKNDERIMKIMEKLKCLQNKEQ